MKKYTFYTQVNNGVLQKKYSTLIKDCIQEFEGKKVTIIIEQTRRKRSNQQNRFYWGCVIPIIKEALYNLGEKLTNEEVHDLIKFKFLKYDKPINEDGLFITKIKSTSELTKSEFMELISEIQQWSSEYFNCIIPDPNTQIEIDY